MRVSCVKFCGCKLRSNIQIIHVEKIPFPSYFNQGKKKKTLAQRIALLVNEAVPAGSHQLMQQPLKLQTEHIEIAILVVN
jgi:hypothetical protein